MVVCIPLDPEALMLQCTINPYIKSNSQTTLPLLCIDVSKANGLQLQVHARKVMNGWENLFLWYYSGYCSPGIIMQKKQVTDTWPKTSLTLKGYLGCQNEMRCNSQLVKSSLNDLELPAELLLATGQNCIMHVPFRWTQILADLIRFPHGLDLCNMKRITIPSSSPLGCQEL